MAPERPSSEPDAAARLASASANGALGATEVLENTAVRSLAPVAEETSAEAVTLDAAIAPVAPRRLPRKLRGPAAPIQHLEFAEETEPSSAGSSDAEPEEEDGMYGLAKYVSELPSFLAASKPGAYQGSKLLPEDWPQAAITNWATSVPKEWHAFFRRGVRFRSSTFMATYFDTAVASQRAKGMASQARPAACFAVHFDSPLCANFIGCDGGGGLVLPVFAAFEVCDDPVWRPYGSNEESEVKIKLIPGIGPLDYNLPLSPIA